MMKMSFNVAAVSDVGLIRQNNEDNLFVPRLPIKKMADPFYNASTVFSSERTFICVCDGMGGHSSGEVASYLAAKEVNDSYKQLVIKDVKNKKTLTEKMNEFISDTNDMIFYKAESDAGLRTMGTTMSGLYFLNGNAYYVNVGDSRCYVLNGRKLVQLSTDHADPVSKNALTRFLGMSSEYGNISPDVAFAPSKIGTKRRYLLCTDGLTDMVDDKSIEGILIENEFGKDAAERLIEEAKKRGGKDNITAIVIDAFPTKKIVRLAKNKILTGCVAAAIVLGAVGTAAYMLRPEDPIGTSLSDLTTDIQNAKNLKEALAGIEDLKNTMHGKLDYYTEYMATVDESDETVKLKTSEMKPLVEEFRTKLQEFEARIDEISTGSASDVEKYEQIKRIDTDAAYIAVDQASQLCEAKQAEIAAQIENWKQWQKAEEERKAREAEEQRQREEAARQEQQRRNSSGGGSSGSASGGSSSSSGSSSKSSSGGGSSGGSSGGGSSSSSSTSSDSYYDDDYNDSPSDDSNSYQNSTSQFINSGPVQNETNQYYETENSYHTSNSR